LLGELLKFLLYRSTRVPRAQNVGIATRPRSIARGGDAPSAQLALGRSLRQAGRPAEAVAQLRHAYAAAPDTPGLLHDLVGALIESDLCDKALSVASAALERDASSYEANVSAGFAYQKLHQPHRALTYYETARQVRGDDPVLYAYRGSVMQELGRLDEALADFERALALWPDFPLARFHRGIARLLAGDYAGGWEGYELRPRSYAPHPDIPVWDGASLHGRTLLVLREQGLGDEIMFASLLPELIGTAGKVIVECDDRLRPIFTRSFPRASFFASIPGGGLPYRVFRQHIDAAIGAGSVARFLRRSASDFPRHDGYLVADPVRAGRWRERLDGLGPQLKVGISWVGGVRQTRRAQRSLPLEQLLPILRTPGVRFISLQYTPGAGEEVDALKASGVAVDHWPEAIADYEETAALVHSLDLVISVCTSLVHLAGAIGRPTWVMAPHSPEWRYGLRGEAMPWYPSVRVFRQPAYQLWARVIDSVREELRHHAEGRRAG